METRTPDDFELFLELILEAPRGQREVFPDNKYKAAWTNDPSASQFPCGGGNCANGTCGSRRRADVRRAASRPRRPAPVDRRGQPAAAGGRSRRPA